MLLEPRYWALKRRAFREAVKAFYWSPEHATAKPGSVAANLSRALARLEERGLIVRAPWGGWRLTYPLVTGDPNDLVNNGETYAILAWKDKKELCTQLGLRGPPPPRKGVEVNLEC